jgi:hypothetical protein
MKGGSTALMIKLSTMRRKARFMPQAHHAFISSLL